VSSGEGSLSHSPCVLVMGFGPFGEVRRNPAAELACAVDGTRVGDTRVVGRSMPVSYQRCVEQTAALWGRHQPGVVLGVGVATSRSRPELERVARARWAPVPRDIDGRTPAWRPSASVRRARMPVEAMAVASGIGVSEDCGTYVCNAWFYTMLGALPEWVKVGFLHIPAAGFSVSGTHRMLHILAERDENHG